MKLRMRQFGFSRLSFFPCQDPFNEEQNLGLVSASAKEVRLGSSAA